MRYQWIKWHLAQVTGNNKLLKKKRLRAQRPKVAKSRHEKELEKRWFCQFVDRRLRCQLRLCLTQKEQSALGIVFDRFTKQYPTERLTRVEFLQMVLYASGIQNNDASALSEAFVTKILDLFDHSQVTHRPHFITPGKDHPYLEERKKKTLRYRIKQRFPQLGAGLGEEQEDGDLDDEREEENDDTFKMLQDTIDLHEFLLCMSFWKRHQAFYSDAVKDDVSYFFWLFDIGGEKIWSVRDFCEAMRTILMGLYISEYEDNVDIPSDCDPQEKAKEDEMEARFRTIEEIERDEKLNKKQRKRKNLIERYLNIVFADIDKAKLGIIDVEDVEEWLQEHQEAEKEFEPPRMHSTAADKNRLEEAFKSVGATDGRLEKEQFYAFIENSHILSCILNEDVEFKFLQLSKKIAEEEFKLDETSKGIKLESFRRFLRDYPDTRLAPLVVRLGRIVRMMTTQHDSKARQALLQVLAFQMGKPIFRDPVTKGQDNGNRTWKRKIHASKSLTRLRKEFLRKSPFVQLKIAPLPDG